MGNCTLNLSVLLNNRQPASFASVSIYQHVCVWFVCWDNYIESVTADVYGNCSFSLNKGNTYHIFIESTSAAGKIEKTSFLVTMIKCPYNITTQLPA